VVDGKSNKSMGIKMVPSGEGADELFEAQSAREFHEKMYVLGNCTCD
jgi:asparagine synthetase B (glutamine-hydrolysing)